MDARIEVDTPLGPIWFWGRDTGRPLFVVITGAFNPPDYMWRIQEAFPTADVVRAHLPGNHCPELRETSIAAFVRAYEAALTRRWPGRTTMVLGVSTGGVVALGLRAPSVRRLVVIEPPLMTAGVWPLTGFREQAPAAAAAFVHAVFGVHATGEEPRDHSWVLDGLVTPTTVLVGDEPLGEPRAYAKMTTLVSREALARLEAHPAITVAVMRGAGHNIPKDAPEQAHAVISRAWSEMVAGTGPP